jgi:hypothetical protein
MDGMVSENKLQVTILLYDGMTALDAIGLYEVLQTPTRGDRCAFVAREEEASKSTVADSA